ncbi:MAG: DUF6384 family protein [Cucumibacter sp.]
MSDTTQDTLPLDHVMLAMDVVDTLRHRQDLVERELDEEKRAASLIGKLRGIYAEQGIDVPDHILKEGVDALAESRFAYSPPRRGFGGLLATFYVTRGAWGRPLIAIAVAAALVFGGYQFAYRPFVAAQQAEALRQLAEVLPAQMDGLYDTIYTETKEQEAVRRATAIRERGKVAAAEGDSAGAAKAVADLTGVRDQLRREFRLKIVNRAGEETGVWTFPDVNTEATNFYIVVEAVSPDDEVLTVPIENEESGVVEAVSKWAVRVSEPVYQAVRQDKLDDGIIQQNIIGVKQFGYLEVDYVVPVLGGAITQW